MTVRGADRPGADAPYRDASRAIAERVRDLLDRMTLDEKVAQLTAVWIEIDPDRGEVAPSMMGAAFGSRIDPDEAMRHGIGQVTRPLGSRPVDGRVGATAVNRLQRQLVEDTRLGIPAICHEECLTGYMAQGATSFASPLNFGATWDPDLVEQVGVAIRRQMMSVGARQGLAPVADVARDPRWGRVEETVGEDPYLVGTMVSAYVRGLQGDDPRSGVIATLKHFAGYSFSEGGRNFAPTHVGRREMADVFLLPFEMAIKSAGAGSVMNSYQEVDGEQPAASRWLLTEVLREQWGFDGFVVADYGAVTFLHAFAGVATDGVAATAMALRAGLDVELPAPVEFPEGIPAAIERDLLSMAEVDRAVERVLSAKFRLGLFDAPYVDVDAVVMETAAERRLATRVAEESVILLANDGILPLDPAAVARVAVVGPNADEMMALFGNYSFENHLVSVHFQEAADAVQVPTLLHALRERFGTGSVSSARGCDVMGDDREDIGAAANLARQADVAIVVVGDKAGHFKQGTVGEGTDRTDLSLPGVQGELVDAVLDTGTPTVLVLLNGRPFTLGRAAERAAAIVEAWFPGQDGAAAVADVLVGALNPSGKLTVSFPTTVGAEPLVYNHKPMARGFPAQDEFGFVFPFGHGLSYTTFAYSDLELAADEVGVDGEVRVSFTITNTGGRAGTEVAQLYVRDVVGSVSRPVLELKGFVRVPLEVGERRRATFMIPSDVLSFTGLDGKRIVEPGAVEIKIGASSADIRLEATVTLIGETRTVGSDRTMFSTASVEWDRSPVT
jgi:beta-glucosidase